MRVTTSKILLLLAAMLVVVSCDEYEINIDTQVFRDGSCLRTITSGNGEFLMDEEGWDYQEIVLPADSSANGFSIHGYDADGNPIWKKDSTRTYVFSRRFDSVEDMSSNQIIQIEGEPIVSKPGLTRSFKWFYTDYTFTETFAGWNNHFNILPTDFVTEDNASFWFTGYPELAKGMTGNELSEIMSDMSEKMEQWAYAVMWDIYFQAIAHDYDVLQNPPVDCATFLSMRDSVIASAWLRDVEFWGRDDPEFKFLDEFFHTDVFTKLEITDEMNDYGSALWSQSLGLLYLEMPYTLKMPGKVMDAGCGTLENGVIKYRFDGGFLIPGDYTFTATSRAVNVWAFLLSGLVLVIAVGSFFIKR